jgi:DNA repair protein RadC
MKIWDIKVKYNLVCEEPEPPVCNSADLAVNYMKGAFDEYPEQESFWVIMLNRKNKPLGRQMITLGTQVNTLVHPREVFRAVLLAHATAFICVHNHPSGDPCPSAADMQVTRQLREAAKVMDITMLDHVIIGRAAADPAGTGYYSFRATGLI